MKVFVITLALAGLASTATLDAQILGQPARTDQQRLDKR